MAIAISSIPILEGKSALKFVKKEKAASKKKATVNFSKEIELTKKILEKAKL